MVDPEDVVLAAAVFGYQFPDHVRYPSEVNVKAGQRIVLLESDGLQTNGLSPMRMGVLDQIAHDMHLPRERRLEAYGKDIGNGQTFGEAVLAPSIISTPLVDALLLDPNPTPIEYMAYISGHGWLKLMRPQNEDLSYVIDRLPNLPQIFHFIKEITGRGWTEMYKTYNMGAFKALYLEPEYVDRVLQQALALGIRALDAGHVEKGSKRVVIDPLGIDYPAEELQIR